MKYAPVLKLKPIVFGCLCASLLGSKATLLKLYIDTISRSAFLLYFPTVILADVFLICLARICLPKETTKLSTFMTFITTAFSLVLVAGAASQIGFYIETGGNINWRDTAAFTEDPEGLVMLLTGLGSVLSSAAVLVVVGVLSGGWLYQTVGSVMRGLKDDLAPVFSRITPTRITYTRIASQEDVEAGSDSGSSDDFTDEKVIVIRPRFHVCAALKLILPIYISALLLVRPEGSYRKMSTTLPVTMLDMLKPPPDACSARHTFVNNPFPFPRLLQSSSWKRAEGAYDKGWAPSANGKLSPLASMYRERQVDWITEEPPRGFFRWDKSRFEKGFYGWLSTNTTTFNDCEGVTEEDVYYNPVSDPLKISNLDMEILPDLQEAMGKIKIKHVIVVMMEGIRDGVWPLQKNSHFYNMLTSHADREGKRAIIEERLSRLSPNAERITGLSMGFDQHYTESNWTNSAKEGFGGINVQGAYTAATMTSKSYQAVLCGTPPMSVDGFEEAEADGYQPCLPQIFDMFNQVPADSDSVDYRDRPWRTSLFESTTEQFDRLEAFDIRLGYHTRFARREIENDKERFNKSLPLYRKVNTFAYPEQTILPHLEMYLDDLNEKNERMFMTHFTSTTHHGWNVPEGWSTEDYRNLEHGRGWGNHLNKYMNTVRYQDEWFGTFLQLLEDRDMAKETLVVFAGDHGLAFLEDDGKEGTYENDHLSNFRVGLTFRHPELPQVQYQANMTTIAVLPTILDMLISSNSLNKDQKHIASDLVHDYEGQSLIRPYKEKDGERRAWAVTVVNPGSRRLGLVSADAPWRITIPLTEDAEYRFTNAVEDPLEEEALNSWTPEGLVRLVKDKMGDEASRWASEAIPIAKWWAKEKMRLWRYKATG